MALPEKLDLEIVTPEGLLLHEDVDELIAPGKEGYFGVRPGHTPLFASLGVGALSYRTGEEWHDLTCFWGFCEVLPDPENAGARGELLRNASGEIAFLRWGGRLLPRVQEA